MWTRNPQPWMHVIDYAIMFGGPVVVSVLPTKNNTIDVLFAGAFIVTGCISYGVNSVVMGINHWRDTVKDVRMFQQPTVEELNGVKRTVREELKDIYIAGGNAGGPIEKASNVRKDKSVPAGFVAMQNTAEKIRLAEVDNAIRKICRQVKIQVEHPDLGYPEGDFREVTWVATGEMSRNTLLLSLAILERHCGIERKGSAKNSTWVVRDLEVIKRGARTPLPHPIGCWCADCAEK